VIGPLVGNVHKTALDEVDSAYKLKSLQPIYSDPVVEIAGDDDETSGSVRDQRVTVEAPLGPRYADTPVRCAVRRNCDHA
jgi:hypothetical protein